MHQGMNYANIPEELIEDCVQLVKANSIEGMLCSIMHILAGIWVIIYVFNEVGAFSNSSASALLHSVSS